MYILTLILTLVAILMVHACSTETATAMLSDVKYGSELIVQRELVQFPKHLSVLSCSNSSWRFLIPHTVFELLIESCTVPGPLNSSGVSDKP